MYSSTMPKWMQTLVSTDKGVLMAAGGLPIEFGGNLYGGIGVSGAPNGQTDEECAQPGLKAVAKDMELLKRLEFIFDTVDRGLDPVAEEEFGRKMKTFTQFARNPSLEDIELATHLESNYDKFADEASFEKVKAKPIIKSLPSCLEESLLLSY